MATTTVKISDELTPKVDNIIKEFGFKSKEEFFQEAIRDKILELHKRQFFKGSNKVAEQLRKKDITEEEIINEFNRQKHK